MQADVIFLAVKSFKFTNDQGEIIQLLKVTYYGHNNLMPKDRGLRKGRTELDRGSTPIDVSLPYEFKDKIKSVPALYQIDYEMDGNSDGKPVIDILDLEYKGAVETKSAAAASK